MDATDDATLFVRGGGRVRMVEGARWNLKVTVPEDLEVVRFLLSRRELASRPQ
jgi:2-C-methyl-D-erythritol 4-phosphate cytidylyltransferase